jgi:DNA-binding MarR family transcriptional regulator
MFCMFVYVDMDDVLVKSLREKFAALSSDSRIKVIFLCQNKELSITELARKINLSHSAMSQNVSVLERFGLVEKTRHKDNRVTVRSLVRVGKDGVSW